MKWVLRAAGTDYFIKQDGTFTNEISEAYRPAQYQSRLGVVPEAELDRDGVGRAVRLEDQE